MEANKDVQMTGPEDDCTLNDDWDAGSDSDDGWGDDAFSDGLISMDSMAMKIKMAMERRCSPTRKANAAETVFSIPELAEMILVYHAYAWTAYAEAEELPRIEPLQSTCAIQRVHRNINWTVNGSPRLQAPSVVHGLRREKLPYDRRFKPYDHGAPLLWLFSQLLPGWKHERAFYMYTQDNELRITLHAINDPERSAMFSLCQAQRKDRAFVKSRKDGRPCWRDIRASVHSGRSKKLGRPKRDGRIVLETPRIRRRSTEMDSSLSSVQDCYRHEDITLKGTATLGEVFDAYSTWLFSIPDGAVVLGKSDGI